MYAVLSIRTARAKKKKNRKKKKKKRRARTRARARARDSVSSLTFWCRRWRERPILGLV